MQNLVERNLILMQILFWEDGFPQLEGNIKYFSHLKWKTLLSDLEGLKGYSTKFLRFS